MKIFKIKSRVHNGKQITVTKYKKALSGVEIVVTHNVPTTTGKQLRWVQTVTENGSFFRACGRRTAVDPFSASGVVVLPGVSGVCKADDTKPFYWTDTEFAGPEGPYFSDGPSEGTPTSGRTWIQFHLGLTLVTGLDVHHLVTIAWGFDIKASGDVLVAPIRRVSADEMQRHFKALKEMYSTYTFT